MRVLHLLLILTVGPFVLLVMAIVAPNGQGEIPLKTLAVIDVIVDAVVVHLLRRQLPGVHLLQGRLGFLWKKKKKWKIHSLKLGFYSRHAFSNVK